MASGLRSRLREAKGMLSHWKLMMGEGERGAGMDIPAWVGLVLNREAGT